MAQQRIEPLAQLRVARRALDAVQPLQITPDARFVVIGQIELQQRRILQPEHRQTRHQRIDQRDRAPAAGIVDRGERTADRAQQPRCRQIASAASAAGWWYRAWETDERSACGLREPGIYPSLPGSERYEKQKSVLSANQWVSMRAGIAEVRLICGKEEIINNNISIGVLPVFWLFAGI